MRDSRRLRFGSFGLLVLLAGCTPDWSGIHGADVTGALLDPPAARRHPTADVVASCGRPEPPSPSIRRHPYLRRVSDAAARIAWTTSDVTPGVLRVWTAGEPAREHRAAVEPTRYLRDARQLAVALEALAPGTIHCYEVRDASGARAFGPAGFRTAPDASSDGHVAFAVFGDSGFGGEDQAAVARQLETVPLDFVLHAGDVAYDKGTLPELEANHFAMYRAVGSTVPFFPAIGDHDDETDRAGPFREVFGAPRYYSFDYGPLHVLVLDAFDGGPEQIAFAERDLASTDRPWKIAVVHEPPYSSGWHGSSGSVRRRFAPLFARHGVRLVFSGDDHDYERSNPIDGVTYVVSGGGGRSVRPVGRSEWTAFSATAFHFVYVTAERDVLQLRAIDATGREFDGAELRR